MVHSCVAMFMQKNNPILTCTSIYMKKTKKKNNITSEREIQETKYTRQNVPFSDKWQSKKYIWVKKNI